MNLIDRLLGRKERTAESISREIATQAGALSAARQRVAGAKAARSAALEAFDSAALKAVTEAEAEAAREVELLEYAIAQLQAAHAAQLEAEKREAFRREVDALCTVGESLTARVAKEYVPAASKIATLIADLAAYEKKAEKLKNRAAEFGEPVQLPNPEQVRKAPIRWTASWPDPEYRPDPALIPDADGHRRGTPTMIHGGIEDAPRGSIRWVNGEPVSAREGVEVRKSGGEWAEPLVNAVGNLPGLRHGEPAIHSKGSRPNQPGPNSAAEAVQGAVKAKTEVLGALWGHVTYGSDA